MRHQLSLATLSEVDGGRVAAAFDLAIKQITADCMDRPGTATSRKVKLTAVAKPVICEDGDCEVIRWEFEVGGETPKRVSRPVAMAPRRSGHCEFNTMSEDDPYQMTIDESEGE